MTKQMIATNVSIVDSGWYESMSRDHDHRGVDYAAAESARDADHRGIRRVTADRFINWAVDADGGSCDVSGADASHPDARGGSVRVVHHSVGWAMNEPVPSFGQGRPSELPRSQTRAWCIDR